jgi:hypothetical protein
MTNKTITLQHDTCHDHYIVNEHLWNLIASSTPPPQWTSISPIAWILVEGLGTHSPIPKPIYTFQQVLLHHFLSPYLTWWWWVSIDAYPQLIQSALAIGLLSFKIFPQQGNIGHQMYCFVWSIPILPSSEPCFYITWVANRVWKLLGVAATYAFLTPLTKTILF